MSKDKKIVKDISELFTYQDNITVKIDNSKEFKITDDRPFNINSGKNLFYGKEGSGKSTLILKEIFNSQLKRQISKEKDKPNIFVVISPSTKQMEEKYNMYQDYKIKNNTIKISNDKIYSQSEICRKLVCGGNQKILDFLKGNQTNLIELNVGMLSDNKIIDKDYIFNNCSHTTLPIDNKNKIFFNSNEVITKLLTYMSNIVKDKKNQNGLIIPIKIYADDISFEWKKNFNKSKEAKCILYNDDIESLYKDLFLDPNNKESVIYNITEKQTNEEIQRGNKLYLVYISYRALRYHKKIIDNSLRESDNILRNKNINNEETSIFHFEYYNFVNKILDPIIDRITKEVNKLSSESTWDDVCNFLREYEKIDKTMQNIKLVVDEVPINISNLTSLENIISKNDKYADIVNKKLDDVTEAKIYSHNHARNSRYKSVQYINIEKINKWDIIEKIIEENKSKLDDKTKKIYDKFKNVLHQKNLNYIFTLFDNINVITSEEFPKTILCNYNYNLYNVVNEVENLNEKVKADIYLIKNKEIRPQNNNKRKIETYINSIKDQYKRKDKCLIVGPKIYENTDTTIQSLKGVNNILSDTDNKLKYESINIFTNPSPPNIGFSNGLIFYHSIKYASENHKNAYIKNKCEKIIKKVNKNNRFIIDEICNYIKLSDDINQGLGRILGKRSELYSKIIPENFLINCYIPIPVEYDDYNFIYLALTKIKSRFGKQVEIIYDEETILSNYSKVNDLREKERIKSSNTNAVLKNSLIKPEFNEMHNYIKSKTNYKPNDISKETKHFIEMLMFNIKRHKLFNSEKTLYFYDILNRIVRLYLDKQESNVDIEKEIKVLNNAFSLRKSVEQMSNKINKFKEEFKKVAFEKGLRDNNKLDEILDELDYLYMTNKEDDKEKCIDKIVDVFSLFKTQIYLSLLKLEFKYYPPNNKELFDIINISSKQIYKETGIMDITDTIEDLIRYNSLFRDYDLVFNKGIIKKEDIDDNDKLSKFVSEYNKLLDENYKNIQFIKENKSGKEIANSQFKKYKTEYFEALNSRKDIIGLQVRLLYPYNFDEKFKLLNLTYKNENDKIRLYKYYNQIDKRNISIIYNNLSDVNNFVSVYSCMVNDYYQSFVFETVDKLYKVPSPQRMYHDTEYHKQGRCRFGNNGVPDLNKIRHKKISKELSKKLLNTPNFFDNILNILGIKNKNDIRDLKYYLERNKIPGKKHPRRNFLIYFLEIIKNMIIGISTETKPKKITKTTILLENTKNQFSSCKNGLGYLKIHERHMFKTLLF